MRRVIKGEEPVAFTSWKELESEEWKPAYANLQNPQKQELHASLLREQGRTCCYCGREIDLDTSHIEHFRPQHPYIALSLDYENLFASCIRETDPGSPLHCGHLKGNWFDEQSYISPLDQDCELQFSYTLDGQIISQTPAASTMIDVLGLGKTFLGARRNDALAGVFDDQFLTTVSIQDLRKIVVAFREQHGGDFTPLFHVIARYAEQLIASAAHSGNS
jgi:uncharacterized protein (TIGR02646 family)